MADQSRIPQKERLANKIRTGKVLDRIQKCALGEIEMTSVQLNAAKVLLNKTLPDLKAIEHTQTPRSIRELRSEDLLDELVRRRADANGSDRGRTAQQGTSH